jgi:leucyl/phenylalanyl-tRNA--protein transferase
MALSWLEADRQSSFPPLEFASDDGLLAVGGDLSSERLIDAYRHGIFPWFNELDPILWWAPDPRMVLFTDEIKVSKSLRKFIKQSHYQVTMNHAFSEVMKACAAPRINHTGSDNSGTWIHPSMIESYVKLHELGAAHSVEVWDNDALVGGLYGVAIGHVFFGESMFSTARDTSKLALVTLARQLNQWQFPLIDCQIYSDHLASMGARTIPRSDFITSLDTLCDVPFTQDWQLSSDLQLIP